MAIIIRPQAKGNLGPFSVRPQRGNNPPNEQDVIAWQTVRTMCLSLAFKFGTAWRIDRKAVRR